MTAADAGGDALARLLSDSELKPLLDAFFLTSTALQRAVDSSTTFDGAEDPLLR